MKRYFSLFTIYIIATGAAFGAGSRPGGAELKTEQGDRPVQAYNQGIQLMHAKKYAEAQVKFEQALSESANFAEAHNNLGFSLGNRVPKITRALLNIIIRPFNSNRTWRKRTNIVVSFSSRWAGKQMPKKISRH